MSTQCGASLPKENSDDGWYWCSLASTHYGPHWESESGTQWGDGTVVEVTTVQEVRAIPNHVHDFVGDHDTCVGTVQGCPLTWGEHKARTRKWHEEHNERKT